MLYALWSLRLCGEHLICTSEDLDMEVRNLGTAGVQVSPLCLGTMMFGGPTDEATSAR